MFQLLLSVVLLLILLRAATPPLTTFQYIPCRWEVAASPPHSRPSLYCGSQVTDTSRPSISTVVSSDCFILQMFNLLLLQCQWSLLRTGLDSVIHHHPSFVDSSDDPKLILPTAGITLLILCTLLQPANVTPLWILWGLTVWLLSPTPEISPCKSNSVMSRTASQPSLPVPSVNPAPLSSSITIALLNCETVVIERKRCAGALKRTDSPMDETTVEVCPISLDETPSVYPLSLVESC